LELLSPLALAENPVAVLTLTAPATPPLALALSPRAVFAALVVPTLEALALVPQATFLASPAAVAPVPLAVSVVGTVPPSALPTQTNCACACGAPRLNASTIANAVPSDETKDNRMPIMTALPHPNKKIIC